MYIAYLRHVSHERVSPFSSEFDIGFEVVAVGDMGTVVVIINCEGDIGVWSKQKCFVKLDGAAPDLSGDSCAYATERRAPFPPFSTKGPGSGLTRTYRGRGPNHCTA